MSILLLTLKGINQWGYSVNNPIKFSKNELTTNSSIGSYKLFEAITKQREFLIKNFNNSRMEKR